MKPLFRMTSLAATLPGRVRDGRIARDRAGEAIATACAPTSRPWTGAPARPGQRQAILRADPAPARRTRPARSRYARSIGCQRQPLPDLRRPAAGRMPARSRRGFNGLEAGWRNSTPRRSAPAAASLEAPARLAHGRLRRQLPGRAAGQASSRQPGLFERLFGGPCRRDAGHAGGRAAAGARWTAASRRPWLRQDAVRAQVRRVLLPHRQFASRGRSRPDASLCQASCPNTEVELYVQPSGREAKTRPCR